MKSFLYLIGGKDLTFKKMGNYLVKKTNSDYYLALSAVVLLILSSILSIFIIPNYDNQITDKETALSTANSNIDILRFDYADQRSWDSQSTTIRNEISLLNSMTLFNLSNTAQILETIKDREKDLLTTQVAGLEALTRHIDTNEVMNKTEWKFMNFYQLQDEKNRTEQIFNDVLEFAIEDRNALEIEAANLKNERLTWYNFIPPLYIFGFLISQFAVLIHWKKGEEKEAKRHREFLNSQQQAKPSWQQQGKYKK